MGSYSCKKYAVLVSIFCLWVTGTFMIVTGAYSVHGLKNIIDNVPPAHRFHVVSIIFLTIGTLLVFSTLIGSFGTIKWNILLLQIFTITLLLVFLFQVIFGIVSFWSIENEYTLAGKINTTLDKIFSDSQKNSKVINFIQSELQCCGTTGPNFWNGTSNTPKSCFADGNIYKFGCQNSLYEFLVRTIKIVGTTILIASLFEVVAAALSLNLVNSIRNYQRRYGKYLR